MKTEDEIREKLKEYSDTIKKYEGRGKDLTSLYVAEALLEWILEIK
jgi:hypothetical protein